jgi:hypothetical protein
VKPARSRAKIESKLMEMPIDSDLKNSIILIPFDVEELEGS